MVDYWYKKITNILNAGTPLFLAEIRTELNKPDRAILLGYLRCLVELRKIKSKNQGNSIIYYKK